MSETGRGFLKQSMDARGVVHLTLDRPDAFNALSDALLTELHTALQAVALDPRARVIVLGASGRAFCAGHDLKELRAAASLEESRRLFERGSKVSLALQRMPQPVIARVQGVATAAGCQLVAMCDLAVASTEARFAASGVNYGLFCSTPGVALGRSLGRKQAMEMLLTGDFIDAHTALSQGLVNRVAAPETLDAEVEALVASILAKPAAAVAAGKALFYRQLEMGIEAAYQLAGQAMACGLMDAAAQEGLSAFAEKRKPNWVGAA